MPDNPRQFSLIDNMILQFDRSLRTVFTRQYQSTRPNPATGLDEIEMTHEQRRDTAAKMRVNHTGEVCAQALYQGQALTAKLEKVRNKMEQSAQEENDHLAWCEQRLTELHSYPSYLNPVWYMGSFMIGALAGLVGDRWSLGFVVETERQVIDHLQKHLDQIPENDHKTHKIIQKMQEDEAHHASVATSAGAAELPDICKHLMQLAAKVMTKTAYYI